MSLWARLRSAVERPDMAIFHGFTARPWGGSNQFLTALRGELRRRGLRVSANLIGSTTRGALLNAFAFDVDLLRSSPRTGCRIVHRVDGPVGLYRGDSDAIDRRILGLNREFAQATVFQSRYSLDAHRELGLDFVAAALIPNACDPRIFSPVERAPAPDGRRKVRLISTSWSDNPNKGAELYRWMEKRLDWNRYAWTFIGRSQIRFERIEMHGPVRPAELAAVLRSHDIYVTASRHDPCSNALLEGLSCGLPALALRSGGHPELVGDGGLLFEGPDDVLDVLETLVSQFATRQASIRVPELAQVADAYLALLLGGEPPR